MHTISKYSMIHHGQRVAVGVSGGKDSLVLLYILKKFQKITIMILSQSQSMKELKATEMNLLP
ncbi:MAG: ATP-binding protein [Candidatus Nitrosocosmicus sp.]|nr:ATP-binding protein [Candidatus Nitrosocosmicus sp.]